MRLAFFTESFAPTPDGVARVTSALASALQARGHSVTVFTPRVPGTPHRERTPEGVEVVRCASLPIPEYPQYRWALFPLITVPLGGWSRRFDVVHVHTPGMMGMAGFLLSRQAKIPLVATFHTNLRDMSGSFEGAWLAHLFFRVAPWWASGLYWRSDALTAPTPEALSQVMGEMGKPLRSRTQVIPNGIETDRFRPGLTSPDWGARVGSAGRPLVTFLGRLTQDKGIHRFLDALAGLPPSPAFLGVVAGQGVEAAAVEKRLATDPALRGRATFIGPVTEEEKPALLAQSRIFVLPSIADTSSVAALEALACGAAGVITNRGGPPALVKEGVTALLVDPTSPSAIGAAIGRLLADPALADRLGRAAVVDVQANASIERSASEFITLYDLLRNGGRRDLGTPTRLPTGHGPTRG